ncbi:MAG: class I SAM-dependent methyltransferase, partial [Phycisphaeraceae bacterium]|nr:class I SAM-dependent methyltransferase [Phycisphaeraceae bacterium]
MNLQADQRFAVVSSLIEGRPQRMLDVGCGPVHEQYRYRDAAERITALDWNLTVYGRAPDNVECVEGDLVETDLPHGRYDLIVAADVLEHVQVEAERAFVKRCVELLRPGGRL